MAKTEQKIRIHSGQAKKSGRLSLRKWNEVVKHSEGINPEVLFRFIDSLPASILKKLTAPEPAKVSEMVVNDSIQRKPKMLTFADILKARKLRFTQVWKRQVLCFVEVQPGITQNSAGFRIQKVKDRLNYAPQNVLGALRRLFTGRYGDRLTRRWKITILAFLSFISGEGRGDL